MCDKKILETAHILYGNSGGFENNDCYSVSDREDYYYDILNRYPAYNEISNGKYGDINYALPAYCVYIGNNEYLKKMATDDKLDLMWHSDLADYAIEQKNVEALKIIVENYCKFK